MIDYLPANVRKSLRKPATAKSFLEIPHRPVAPPFRRPERASLHPGESLREVLNLKKCLFTSLCRPAKGQKHLFYGLCSPAKRQKHLF